jgi:hypothetical protein
MLHCPPGQYQGRRDDRPIFQRIPNELDQRSLKMTDNPIDLDQHALRLRQDELEAHLVRAPAANSREAARKARYLLNLFANSLTGKTPADKN